MLGNPWDYATWSLVVTLGLLMLAACEIGYRHGYRWGREQSEHARTVSNMVKASILGLVTFLLGFSFSMTSTRHEIRRKVVLDEANAIGTLDLRATLLQQPEQYQLRSALRKLVRLRLALPNLSNAPDELDATRKALVSELDVVWSAVQRAHEKSPQSVLVSQIVPSANEVIDLNTTRYWAANSHMPAAVLVMLAACAVVACMLIGHSCGQTERRHAGLWFALITLFGLTLYVILDFDRPTLGVVRVDHTPLEQVQKSFEANPLSPPPE
jgi:hypothetical protein